MSTRLPAVLVAATAGALVMLPTIVSADDGDGFEGFIQSGTCASPTDDVMVELESEADHDVEPYPAEPHESGDPVTLGYYGSAELNGFSPATIYAGEEYSLVVEDAEGTAVSCGDILQPAEEDFTDVGVAVVQLAAAEGSEVQGVAVLQRAQLERELDVAPARARILLTDDPEMAAPGEMADAYEGYVQAGTCESPSESVKVDLASDEEDEVTPYLAEETDSPLAYYGSALMPGYGLATTYTDLKFSLAITESGGDEPVACGDILEPDDEDWTDAGLQLVQLAPTGESGAAGYALLQRIGMQRELDVTPTRTVVILFAPPSGEGS